MNIPMLLDEVPSKNELLSKHKRYPGLVNVKPTGSFQDTQIKRSIPDLKEKSWRK